MRPAVRTTFVGASGSRDIRATDPFSRSPVSRAYRPFTGPILKVAYGSRNYGDGDKGLAPLDIIFILDKFLKIDDVGVQLHCCTISMQYL
jgi:hypothetical protein